MLWELSTVFSFFYLYLLAKLIYRILGNYFWISDWQSKYVFVTGCDSGFGFHTALKLIDNGVKVFACCLTDEGKEKLRSSRPKSSNLWTLNLNVTSDISVEEAVKFVKQGLGTNLLWAVVNNAGISLVSGPDDFMTMNHYKQHMDVNFFGQRRVTQAFKPFIKQSRGRIIFVTSIQGRLALPETAPYNASKWATEAYADTVRRELWDYGVRIMIIEPGGFRTGLNAFGAKNFEKLWEILCNGVKAEYGEKFYQSADTTSVPHAIIEAAFSKVSYTQSRAV